jgi:hypothetical protein
MQEKPGYPGLMVSAHLNYIPYYFIIFLGSPINPANIFLFRLWIAPWGGRLNRLLQAVIRSGSLVAVGVGSGSAVHPPPAHYCNKTPPKAARRERCRAMNQTILATPASSNTLFAARRHKTGYTMADDFFDTSRPASYQPLLMLKRAWI